MISITMVQFSKPGGFGLVVIGIPPMQILNSKALHCALLLCDRAPFEQQWGIGKASGQQERVTAARRRVWAGCLGIFAVKASTANLSPPHPQIMPRSTKISDFYGAAQAI